MEQGQPGPSVGATDPNGLVSQMRLLVRANEKADLPIATELDERQASYGLSAVLMLLLVVVIFATSALPDLLPRLSQMGVLGR